MWLILAAFAVGGIVGILLMCVIFMARGGEDDRPG
jgi:hypothetical protein